MWLPLCISLRENRDWSTYFRDRSSARLASAARPLPKAREDSTIQQRKSSSSRRAPHAERVSPCPKGNVPPPVRQVGGDRKKSATCHRRCVASSAVRDRAPAATRSSSA